VKKCFDMVVGFIKETMRKPNMIHPINIEAPLLPPKKEVCG
jgi:hypothetical protein